MYIIYNNGRMIKYGVINCQLRSGYRRVVTVYRLSYKIESHASIKTAANLPHVACVYLEHCLRQAS